MVIIDNGTHLAPMDSSLVQFARLVEAKMGEFISALNMQLDLPEDLLVTTWQEIEEQLRNPPPSPMSSKVRPQVPRKRAESEENEDEGCRSVLKGGPRQGEPCGKRIAVKSITQHYCSTHLKMEKAEPEDERRRRRMPGCPQGWPPPR